MHGRERKCKGIGEPDGKEVLLATARSLIVSMPAHARKNLLGNGTPGLKP